MVEEITDFEVLEIAVRELAIEHGLFTADDHRRFTEWTESVGPAAGSRLVAKAWTDPAFKARVMQDAVKACKEIGIDWSEPTGFGTPSDYMNFRVLEDTPTLHHVIVCTLCSCYPRPLLGMSPEWYRTTNYRRRLVRWPRAGPRGVRFDTSTRGRDTHRGLQPEMPLHGSSGAARRHEELDGEATCGDRHARLHDRRGSASPWQDRGHSSRSQGAPAGSGFGAFRGGCT